MPMYRTMRGDFSLIILSEDKSCTDVEFGSLFVTLTTTRSPALASMVGPGNWPIERCALAQASSSTFKLKSPALTIDDEHELLDAVRRASALFHDKFVVACRGRCIRDVHGKERGTCIGSAHYRKAAWDAAIAAGRARARACVRRGVLVVVMA